MVNNSLITAQMLAKELNLSVETIWRYTREQRIPFIELSGRQYRYQLSEVLKALGSTVSEQAEGYYAGDAAKKITYEDYCAIPEEPGVRFEVLDGLLVKEPSATVPHQRVSRRLQRFLEDYFLTIDPAGEVFDAPLDVTLGKYTVVQPDLFYISSQQKDLVLHARVDGGPTLVVEILSPSSLRKDRLQKMRIYQNASVAHYWIVDPEERTVECYCLNGGLYTLVVSGMDSEELTHPSLPGLQLALSALW